MTALQVLRRTAIYVPCAFLLLVDFVWFFHGITSPMGYGGRSPSAIAVLVIFGVVIPVGASVHFTLKAFNLAEERAGSAALYLFCSVACIAVGWMIAALATDW